jgi:hypothetical protein
VLRKKQSASVLNVRGACPWSAEDDAEHPPSARNATAIAARPIRSTNNARGVEEGEASMGTSWQERRERTLWRPAVGRARATPELRWESRRGFAPLFAGNGERRGQLACRRLVTAARGLASSAATSGDGWGWGHSGSGRVERSSALRKRTAARDSGSVCPEERQLSRTRAFTNPRRSRPAGIGQGQTRAGQIRS